MSRPTQSPTTLAEFHEEVMAEARANGYPGPTLRQRLACSGAFLLWLVGSLALGDTTVAQAITAVSSSI